MIERIIKTAAPVLLKILVPIKILMLIGRQIPPNQLGVIDEHATRWNDNETDQKTNNGHPKVNLR